MGPPSTERRLVLQAAPRMPDVVLASVSTGTSGTPSTAILPAARLEGFQRRVVDDAARGAGLAAATLDDARALYGELFGSLPPLAAPGVLRVRAVDPRWEGLPWEALLRPGDQEALGTQAGLAVVREPAAAGGSVGPSDAVAAVSVALSAPPGVAGAQARLLVVSPLGPEAASHLTGLSLGGRLNVLPAVLAPLRVKALLAHLQSLPQPPHGLHFVGHGRLRGGVPELCLGQPAELDEDLWISAESLANHLFDLFGGRLRWVYLESCRTGAAGTFGSAARKLVERGVPAAVGQLWDVPQRAARVVAEAFYGALLAPSATTGDPGRSLQRARSAALGEPAAQGVHHLAPVVYLGASTASGASGAFEAPAAVPGGLPAEVERALSAPGALVLGEALLAGTPCDLSVPLRQAMVQRLAGAGESGADVPLAALAQRVQMAYGRAALRRLFAGVLDHATPAPVADGLRVVEALAGAARPGVHLSLLWMPWLELALARARPEARVWAVQPMLGERDALYVERRDPGAAAFTEVAEVSFDLERDYVVLQLYGGQTPAQGSGEAQAISEDEQLRALAGLETCLPRAIQDAVFSRLRGRPWALVGLRALDWPQRALVRRLLDGQPMRTGSVAWLGSAPGLAERNFWTNPPPGGCGASLVVGSGAT